MQPESNNIKQAAQELIKSLPDNITWNDVVYEMVVRREIELGLQDSQANRVTEVDDIIKEFGIEE